MPSTVSSRPLSVVPDHIGAAYFIAAITFLVTSHDLTAAATQAHPYAMGFAKFGILATFGECLKNRILTSR